MGALLMLVFVIVVVVVTVGLVVRAVLADRQAPARARATTAPPPDPRLNGSRPARARLEGEEVRTLVPPTRLTAGTASRAMTAPAARSTGSALDPAGSVGPVVAREPAPEPATLSVLLQGVRLPGGLVPMAVDDTVDAERYGAFVTAEVPPDEVGSALADELERHGYRLHSLSDAEAVARRGHDLLSLRLHPEAAQGRAGAEPLFPGVSPATVGLEIWVGAGPNPRTG